MSDQGGWPLYEVFLRGKRGLNHVHVGSLHAADAEMALHLSLIHISEPTRPY